MLSCIHHLQASRRRGSRLLAPM